MIDQPLPSSPSRPEYDAVVVGSGPNGFAAAITIARAGHSVLVVEARDTPGGGMRSAELTRPGYVHDVCSAVHPLGSSSPFFASLPLAELGLTWCHPGVPLAHPLDDGSAVVQARSTTETADNLDPADRASYLRLMQPLVDRADDLFVDLLAPLRWPRHPLSLSRFGVHALRSCRGLAMGRFRGDRARALLAGNAGHSVLPLDRMMTAAVGIMLGVSAHARGWPFARGGSRNIVEALTRYLLRLGGELVCGYPVARFEELPRASVYLFDTSPAELVRIAGDRLSRRYRRRIGRYRYGPAAYKLDLALSEPVPWKASACSRAGTVHVGGTLEQMLEAEAAPWQGRVAARPFVLVAQQSLFDSSRTPDDGHTCWAYCHVPHGYGGDAGESIERQIERFAPGFRDCIVERHATGPRQFSEMNANYVGGDIIGGVQDLRQLFTRPTLRANPYTTPDPAIFLCSASTPPGAGVHGMCGYHAAGTALKRL